MPLSLTQVGGFKLLTSMGAEDSYYGDPLLASEPRMVAGLIIDHLSRVTARGAAALNLRRLLSNGRSSRSCRHAKASTFTPSGRNRKVSSGSTRSMMRMATTAKFRAKHKVERCRRRLSEHFEPENYGPEDPEPDRAAAIMIDMLERRYCSEAGQAPSFAAKANIAHLVLISRAY